MKNDQNTNIAAIVNTAPFPIIMAIFMLIYAIWFGFAWGAAGWVMFVILVLYAVWLIAQGVRYLRFSKTLPKLKPNRQSERIGKQMAKLSTWTYGPLWVLVILLVFFQKPEFIMPIVTLIIGVHFIFMGRIFSRKIDYLLALPPICMAFVAIYLAASGAGWQLAYAVSGIGGAIATACYGFVCQSICLQAAKNLTSTKGAEIVGRGAL